MSTLPNLSFSGKKVLITAGPTYEKIDPVRFIGNYSSGKMGYAIAEEFADMGADVVLVSGPVSLTLNHKGVRIIHVESAIEMFNACMKEFDTTDIAIMAAAVADYRPETYSDMKVKKTEENMTLRLVRNPDILATIAKEKKQNQVVIGFALETNDGLQNAKKKLNEKNVDAIILNVLDESGSGFKHETNQISFIQKNGIIFDFPLKTKNEVAADIADCVLKMI